MVCRNNEGKLVDGDCQSVKADCADIAETYAFKAGVQMAVEKQWQKVEFEIDYETLHKALTQRGVKCNWKLVPLIKDIQALLLMVPEKRILLIIRNANKVANWVAAQAIKGMCGKRWLRLPPSSLVFVLNNDGLPAPPC